MKKFFQFIERHPAISLAFIAPIFESLLTGITRPALFINPANVLLNLLPVSFGAVLIRELVIRWKSGWKGLVLLALAFAALKTGFFDRAIYNSSLAVQDGAVNPDYVWGLSWRFHMLFLQMTALFGIIVPIKIIDICTPKTRDQATLNAAGLWLCVGAIAAKVTNTFLQKSDIKILPAQALVFAVIILLSIAGAIFLKEKKEETDRPPQKHGVLNATAGVFVIMLPIMFSDFDWFLGPNSILFIACTSITVLLFIYLVNNRLRNMDDFQVLYFIAGATIFITTYQILKDYPKFQGYLIINIIIFLFFHLLRMWLKERSED